MVLSLFNYKNVKLSPYTSYRHIARCTAHTFLTLILDGGEWSIYHPLSFNTGIYSTGGSVGLTVGL